MKRITPLARWIAGVGTACLLALGSVAAHADAGSLRSRHAELKPQLQSNSYGRQMFIDSTEGSNQLQGDVYAVLEKNCAPCHAGTMYVVSFTTRDMWRATRAPGMSYGQYAADQVVAEKMPPPTAPAQPSPVDRALLVEWVAAGMPAGSCGPLTPPPR